MDENASRAVFLGVSVLVAIITITLIVTFYRTAKDSAAVANRYDITNSDNKYVNEILSKGQITGLELRYLLNYYANDDSMIIAIYQPGETAAENTKINIDNKDYWSDENQQKLDEQIRPNYNYGLAIDTRGNKYVIVATFEN